MIVVIVEGKLSIYLVLTPDIASFKFLTIWDVYAITICSCGKFFIVLDPNCFDDSMILPWCAIRYSQDEKIASQKAMLEVEKLIGKKIEVEKIELNKPNEINNFRKKITSPTFEYKTLQESDHIPAFLKR